MSVSSHVFLDHERLPSVAAWNAALEAAGIPLVLEPVDDLVTFNGYLPAKLNGRDVGFEWFYGPVSDTFGDVPDVPDGPDGLEGRTHAAEFVTHSEMADLVAAMYASAILARLTNGLPFDTECGEFTTVDDLLATAAETAKEITLTQLL